MVPFGQELQEEAASFSFPLLTVMIESIDTREYGKGGKPLVTAAQKQEGEAAKTKHGKNGVPLMAAAENRDEVAVLALLAAGYEDLEEKMDGSGFTALIWAAARGLDSSVKALLAAGANRDAQDSVSMVMHVMTLPDG